MSAVIGVPPELLRLPCRVFFERVFSGSSTDPSRAPAVAFLARL